MKKKTRWDLDGMLAKRVLASRKAAHAVALAAVRVQGLASELGYLLNEKKKVLADEAWAGSPWTEARYKREVERCLSRYKTAVSRWEIKVEKFNAVK
jgi:hypothetical protein